MGSVRPGAYLRTIAMPVPPGIISQFERALREGRFAQAIAHAERAVALSPADAIAMDMLRTALYGAGRYAESLTQARGVVELIPAHAGSWASLGFVLARVGKHEDAAGAFSRAESLDGATPGYAIERITALIHAGLLAEAEIAARGAIARFGSLPELVFRLSTSLCEQGRTAEAAAELSAALFADPANAQLALTQCSIGVYSDSISPDALSAMHRNFGRIITHGVSQVSGTSGNDRTHAKAAGPSTPNHPRAGRGAGGRVRVGIVSSDFRAHSVAWFARGVLCGLDRQRFETRVYSTSARTDSVTTQLQDATVAAGGVWIPSAGLSAKDLRTRLLADRIDLLLDLNGLTEGGCWEVLAQRAAPVQCSFLGYPHTTGLASVDYRLVDERTDPREPRVDAWHVERLIRMDTCFLCYRPASNAELPDVARRAAAGGDGGDGAGAVVFGSFNRLAKVSPRCKRAWANVLHRVPGSRLVI
ncbi:MAG: tetratricopeptide repeat protein, partial [Phycisphaerales bacterium]|nr:tetratricopeptide repeat protein [Phycisphaerales bacterium]